jgi:hypothetical protein
VAKLFVPKSTTFSTLFQFKSWDSNWHKLFFPLYPTNYLINRDISTVDFCFSFQARRATVLLKRLVDLWCEMIDSCSVQGVKQVTRYPCLKTKVEPVAETSCFIKILEDGQVQKIRLYWWVIYHHQKLRVCTVVPTFRPVIFSKTCRGYVKPRIIPNAVCNAIFV